MSQEAIDIIAHQTQQIPKITNQQDDPNDDNLDNIIPQNLKRTDTDTTKTFKIPKTIQDLNYFYEIGHGRLVIDPLEAEAEFGKNLANQLKLDKTGRIILWPQPIDNDMNDPQNWSDFKKLKVLIVLTMSAFMPDFASGIGIACLFPLATQFNTTTSEINNVSSNWSIFLLGLGGLFAVVLVKKYGRLPILFWSQVLGLGFLIGCTFAPNLKTFAAMRCLNSFFSTAPQIMGLYSVNDMYPFHLQARMLNIWTAGFVVSPFVSPWLFGYLVDKLNYKWAYGIGCLYGLIVVILITLMMEETIYDRSSASINNPIKIKNLKNRIKDLTGITGYQTSHRRCTWKQAIWPMFQVLIRPHVFLILIYVGAFFGFGIGINVTNVVFTSSPPPLGYGLSQIAVASLYATPIVSVMIGEVIGRSLNDKTATYLTIRNQGIFEPEMRLWSLYYGLPFLVAGFVLLGAAFQDKLSVAAIVFGWGLAEVGIMISTVACYNYLNNAVSCVIYILNTYSKRKWDIRVINKSHLKQLFFPGEISALLNEARVLGGFAVPYFQIEWASKKGALQSFGCEAAIIAGLFLLIIPMIQLKGEYFRIKFSLSPDVPEPTSQVEKLKEKEQEGFETGPINWKNTQNESGAINFA